MIYKLDQEHHNLGSYKVGFFIFIFYSISCKEVFIIYLRNKGHSIVEVSYIFFNLFDEFCAYIYGKDQEHSP